MAIGATAGVGLAVWSATSHLWSDYYFLAGFALACALTVLGLYVLIAEFFGGIGPFRFPLPPTRHEREARKPDEQIPKPQLTRSGEPPLSSADRARIARETEQRIAREIHDPELRHLDGLNKAQSVSRSPVRQHEIDPEPSLPLPDLADHLSRFREQGVAIRREIKPPTGYATSSMSVLNQVMPALAEQRVRSWSASVRAYLEGRAPRFLVVFDEGPDLPRPHLFASVVPTTKQPELLVFLDHKLAELDRIIRRIIEGSTS